MDRMEGNDNRQIHNLILKNIYKWFLFLGIKTLFFQQIMQKLHKKINNCLVIIANFMFYLVIYNTIYYMMRGVTYEFG